MPFEHNEVAERKDCVSLQSGFRVEGFFCFGEISCAVFPGQRRPFGSTHNNQKENDMSSNEKPTTRATLGLTGLTMNAMALIAPGAFLWLTFFIQSAYGAPLAAQGMWFGIFAALLLCLATAISYAELSKLYPGAGSSYFFAEQAFLSKTHAYKFARIAKFMVGWAKIGRAHV